MHSVCHSFEMQGECFRAEFNYIMQKVSKTETQLDNTRRSSYFLVICINNENIC